MIEEDAAPPPGVGEVLRAAREAKGLSLAQVAEQTRITQRHLALIEAGDFAQLPGRTYAIGFSRNFARVVGLDEAMIAEHVREELALIDPDGAGLAPRTFEPGDPARVPTSSLAWLAGLVALALFVVGTLFVWRTYVSPGMSLPWLTQEEEPAPAQTAGAATPTPVPTGQVVFTANEQIWVRFYERGGSALLEKEMLAGESFTVPSTAVDPWLITARPDALTVTVGGRQLPPLAVEQDMLDLPVSAEELVNRPPEVAATPNAAPAARARPAASRSAAPAVAPVETPEPAPPPAAAPAPSPTD
jgi:cytoskeleton protein RodZ